MALNLVSLDLIYPASSGHDHYLFLIPKNLAGQHYLLFDCNLYYQLTHIPLRIIALCFEVPYFHFPIVCMKLFLFSFAQIQLILDKRNVERKARKVKKYPNEHLMKEVEIVGFAGCAIDIQLLVYLLECAINLEKIVINPCSPYIKGIPCPENVRTTVKYKGAREAAKRLKEKLLTRPEFVIM